MGELGEQAEKFYIGLDFSTQQVGVGGSGSQTDSHRVRCILEKLVPVECLESTVEIRLILLIFPILDQGSCDQ